MTDHDDARLEPRERALVQRIEQAYAPPPETPARRAAFSERLRARLEPRERPLWAPALAAVALACLVWVALPTKPPSSEDALDDGAWEYELLVSSDVSPAADRDESLYLPDDYQAIAQAFLDS